MNKREQNHMWSCFSVMFPLKQGSGMNHFQPFFDLSNNYLKTFFALVPCQDGDFLFFLCSMVLRRKVMVRFVDFGRVVDHYWLDFLFIIRRPSLAVLIFSIYFTLHMRIVGFVLLTSHS